MSQIDQRVIYKLYVNNMLLICISSNFNLSMFYYLWELNLRTHQIISFERSVIYLVARVSINVSAMQLFFSLFMLIHVHISTKRSNTFHLFWRFIAIKNKRWSQ